MNGCRLGSYEAVKKLYGISQGDLNRPDNIWTWVRSVLAGGTSGVLGASLGSPFFFVKVI